MDEIWLDDDLLTDTRTILLRDNHAGENQIVQTQDVRATVEMNKALYADRANEWKGNWHHVAQIPLVLYFQLKKEGIIDDPVRFKKWLNDRDNRSFRTKPGNI